MSNTRIFLPRIFMILAIFSILFTASTNAEIRHKEYEKIQRFDPTNPKFNELTVAGPTQPNLRKPASSLTPIPAGNNLPVFPQTNFCDIIDYTSGEIGYFWTVPDAYDDDLFNMRFTSDAGFDCSLKVAHYLLYWESPLSGPKTFNSDMRCYLWDDDGFGLPGVKLDSVDIPFATLDAEHTVQGNLFFISADFSAGDWVFSDGAEYHLGYTALNQTSGSVAIISDYGDGPYSGEERTSEFYNGQWGSILNDWGIDVSFFIMAENCCSEILYSDCYSDLPLSNVSNFWRAPHPVYSDIAYAQKFSVVGQDTLKSVDFAIYDDAASPSSYDPAGNNEITISVYADDGFGLPDQSNLLAQQTLLAGTYPLYPSLASVTFDYVFDGEMNDYHIAFSTDGVAGVSYESCLSSDGSDGTNSSSSNIGGGNWVDMLTGWGTDVNFYFVPNICVDPNSSCLTNQYDHTSFYFWRLPDRYGDIGQAQLMTYKGSVDGCRVEEVEFDLYWRKGENTAAGWHKYEDSAKVAIYSNLAGHPGAELASIMVGPDDYQITEPSATVSTFGTLNVDFRSLNVMVSNDYWVSVETQIFDTLKGIYTFSDDGSWDLPIEGYVETWGDWNSNWGPMCTDWNLPCKMGMMVKTKECCVPAPPIYCQTYLDNGWATYQGDYARTGRSELSVGQSQCDLNLNWSIEHPTEGISFTGPTIWQDKVIQGFNSEYQVLDLATGSLIYTIDQTTSGSSLNWSSIRGSGTIHHINSIGKDVLFVGGGSSQGVYAFDINSGSVLWHFDPSNGGPIAGQTRWGTFIVMDMGALDVLYYGTDNGNIVAVEAATGLLYSGWTTNPVNLGYATSKTGSTDGTYLYYGTYSTAGEGDIFAIDPLNGSIVWQLSGTAGLQAGNYFGADYTGNEEGFESVAYDVNSGNLFANSRCEGDYPTDGLMYSIHAWSGTLNAFTLSNRAQRASPIIGLNKIYMPTFSRWVGPPAGGNLIAFDKNSLAISFATSTASEGRYYADGLLTCEESGEPGQLFLFNEDGFLSSFRSDNGEEIFRRRIFHATGYVPNVGMAGAIAQNPNDDIVHMLFADFWGTLYDFTKGDERQRLQFHTYNPTGTVEFGSATSLTLDMGPFITNTGCTILTVETIATDELPFAPDVPTFSSSHLTDELLQKSSGLATMLTSVMSDKLDQRTNNKTISTDAFLTLRQNSKEINNAAASGAPTFINSVVLPYAGQILSPGEDVNLILDVIQSAILRGPQSFYIQIGTDDPDFFLNDPILQPQAFVTIVGGCLTDTTTLEFGVGGANIQLVTNSGRLGTGDWSPHGFDIDGDQSSYYQGAYIYGVSQYRIATNSQDWTGGGGEADALVSMQPDPNYCDNQCKPALTTFVSLGQMWDGSAYQPVIGKMVCASYLDSVQQMGEGNWDDFTAPFDNDSTIGLYVNQRTIGVLEVPELANMTLAIMEITERNGNAIPNWYLGSFHDYDVGSLDTVEIDRSISTGWVYSPGDNAWGQIKIPFGSCDGEPFINVHGMEGNQALWDMNAYFDSAYFHMSKGTGHFSQTVSTGDGEAHFTIDSHDFAPNETYTVGVVNFGLHGLTDNSSGTEIAPLANLVNKWAGFGRGDLNNDNTIDLADIIYLASYINNDGPGPIPFLHLGDIDCNGGVDFDDLNSLIDYYFNCGACPCGAWEI